MYKEDQNKVKRFYCNDRFTVSSISYNDSREISSLVVVNEKGETVYELKEKGSGVTGSPKGKATGKNKNSSQEKTAQKTEQKNYSSISKEQMDSLQAELARTGVSMETVQERYKIQEPKAMGEELYSRVMSALKRTKSTEAA